MAKPPKKKRAALRKNRTSRARSGDWTRRFAADQPGVDDAVQGERISGKGELSRKRTIITADSGGVGEQLEVDQAHTLTGRVLSVRGLLCDVETAEGVIYQCVTRRLLRTLSTDDRHVVAAGDRVLFSVTSEGEGSIERVEPRHGVLSRTVRGRRHVIVANVDQLLIVTSAAEPTLKPNLLDRFLISAHANSLRPLICINKIDLVDAAEFQPLVGVYARMGYQTLLVSARSGMGIDRLRRALAGRASVVAGQSGVGKSSLLNAIDPALNLRVRQVSAANEKGRHTTTAARLWPIASGGYMVDTPGVRQFQLWDVIPAEVIGYFRDLRPFVSLCRFPDCTHTHEDDCAVKDAVADGRLDLRRYESYCHLFAGDEVAL